MIKRLLVLAGLLTFLVPAAPAELGSLSHLYLLGKGVRDTDGDGLADRVSLTIVVPENPSPTELALAADIAARANLESLAQDFSLVKRESEIPDVEEAENLILIGTNVKWLREAIADKDILVPALSASQGYVGVFGTKTQTGLFLVAGSEEALLQAGRAFFLRWPYFWDIWGREEGGTFETLERDVNRFLNAEGIALQRTIVRSALYDFPHLKKAAGPLGRIAFNAGEIRDLGVEVYFTDEEDLARAATTFEALRLQHARGQRVEILTYSGCGRVSVGLRFGKTARQAILPRLGSPRRMLTPSFKDVPRADGTGKEFDLLGLLTPRGVYGDMDRDGIADSIDSRIVVPPSGLVRGLAPLASKLVLHTAGASFPLIALDREVEHPKALVAPILVGANALTQELQRVGKLSLPPLDHAAGLIRAVPKAFNKSSALVVTAGDAAGLEKTLNYLSRVFPYFDAFEDGRPKLADAAADIERFLKGEKGAAEAYFFGQLKKLLDDLRGRDIESLRAEVLLPRSSPPFEEALKRTAGEVLAVPAEIKTSALTEAKKVFEKEQTFAWEADEAFALVREKLPSLDDPQAPLRISLGLSESPEVRSRVRKQVEGYLQETLKSEKAEVEVLSAYKQGFFWILEKVLPALKGKPVAQIIIRFAEEREDFGRPKRFYSDPSRWLQELYPIDELISRETGLPLDKVQFEMAPASEPTYRVYALDAKNAPLVEQSFSPRWREMPYLKPMPEWGTVKVTTGWVRIERGGEVLEDRSSPTDLERLWSFFQDEGLVPVQAQILKKTGHEPTFSKQPFFKQLRAEVWASEPDLRLGLDEEVVSALEALHDEIYFDTLDFLRGMTEIDAEADAPEDTSRFSAPGNVLPVIHPSTEGGAPKISIRCEDWLAATPQMTLTWKERGREEATKKIAFPSLKAKTLALPSLVYNGLEERIEHLTFDLEFDKESDFLLLLDLLASYRDLLDRGALVSPLSFPKLNGIVLALRCGGLAKEERIPVAPPAAPTVPAPLPPRPGEPIVDTSRIQSPEMVLDAIGRLAAFPALRTYIAGASFENRKIPVIEIFRPLGPYVSIPRLIAAKPTLYMSGRQHANEVSSTNYVLKLAELLATDRSLSEFVNRINFVLHPMENPDGAALAFDLQNLTPFHSLHAGRYSALGLEIGTMTGAARPLLPEAAVKRDLSAKWAPDISLNLHGYPSHEWVQQFSSYSPFLFRDYWIPKGWFAYVRAPTLPIYDRYKTAGEDVRSFIIAEMNADPRIKDSNRKFTDRYFRWATRWQPHLAVLELYDGLNLYAKRRGSSENRLTARGQVTYIEETPELMDETARGAWLDFLSTQGLAYLRAHMKYLAQAEHQVVRVEEEIQDRVRIQFLRGRPGTTKK